MSNSKLAIAGVVVLGFTAFQAAAALSNTDRDFVQKAASGGMAEVELGQLAQNNATSQLIKEFGQRMVTDHGQANMELQRIAQNGNFTLPTRPDSKSEAIRRQLSGLQGSAFDTAYTQSMLSDHQEDIAEFQKEAQSGEDPALKAFAQKTLPVLQHHLQMAQAMHSAK